MLWGTKKKRAPHINGNNNNNRLRGTLQCPLQLESSIHLNARRQETFILDLHVRGRLNIKNILLILAGARGVAELCP